ncbi:putative membrane protein YqhA [Hasllibacter halocynthiae]|uniref:Putative membrane protein YqhA n=1 Tax=Hasllibacter halocynthiae TaxID=595589 RepID=A0A2T0XA40_9RHOB|nr:YqhA family protein [Hasllibacter halocynthiae]PRY95763.1 putative membrane protein YqhA [Hasllibacter halocynthiae]
MRRVFSLVRYIAMLGVLASAILSGALYLAILIGTVQALGHFAAEPLAEHSVRDLLHRAIEQTDMLLVATTLLIVSIGLYSLFIGALDRVPPSLEITSFSSLKEKLIALVVAVLAVHFYSVVTAGGEGEEILLKGAAIGIVIGALAVFMIVRSSHGSPEGEAPPAGDGYR